MNAFTLKLIALIAMIIDHTADVFVKTAPLYTVMRSVGRLAFPIYCFLLVEGYHRTRNVFLYLTRLGIFALISEIPFDLCFEGRLFAPGHQNVFISLFLGLFLLIVLENYAGLPLKILAITSISVFAQQIHCDYRYIGILMILFFELYREIPFMLVFTQLLCNIKFSSVLQNMGIFALIPIQLYNGKKGPSLKYFFYAAYPAHLLAIYFMARYKGIY